MKPPEQARQATPPTHLVRFLVHRRFTPRRKSLYGLICPAGFEPATSSSGVNRRPLASENLSEVTSSPAARCTARCTGEADSANEPTADPLADFVSSLTAEQRQRLAALLTGKREADDDA